MQLEKCSAPGRYRRFSCTPASSRRPTASTLIMPVSVGGSTFVAPAASKKRRWVERDRLTYPKPGRAGAGGPAGAPVAGPEVARRRATQRQPNTAPPMNSTIHTMPEPLDALAPAHRHPPAAVPLGHRLRQTRRCSWIPHGLLAPLLVGRIVRDWRKYAARSTAESAASIAQRLANQIRQRCSSAAHSSVDGARHSRCPPIPDLDCSLAGGAAVAAAVLLLQSAILLQRLRRGCA